MTCSVQFDFIQAASYGNGTSSSGEVRIVKDTQAPVVGRHVVLVEDIVDSGRTLARLSRLLRERGALSVRVCALLDKPSRRVPGGVDAEYVGFSIEDLIRRRLRAGLCRTAPRTAVRRRFARGRGK